jgi:hypothetical protein
MELATTKLVSNSRVFDEACLLCGYREGTGISESNRPVLCGVPCFVRCIHALSVLSHHVHTHTHSSYFTKRCFSSVLGLEPIFIGKDAFQGDTTTHIAGNTR